jgi:hypothetical protein
LHACIRFTRVEVKLTRLDSAKNDLADKLKEYVEENNPLAGDSSMYADLLGAALSEVDWYEMAEHYLADIDTEEEPEEETEEVE